jgi:Na+/proline symporter
MSLLLIPVHVLFLGLGVLLFLYVEEMGLFEIVKNEEATLYMLTSADGLSVDAISLDRLFPTLAAGGYFTPILGVVFLIGLIAAAYSSADSALTSLTTTFCIDILEDADNSKKRLLTHIGMSVVLIMVILIFKFSINDSVVWKLFKMTGFTYGPLLGLFGFGLLNKRLVKDIYIPLVAIICPIVSYILDIYSKDWFDYQIGFEILFINGGLTFLGLLLCSKKSR